MPWVRFDDQFPIHRKVKGLTDAEYRLHTEAIFWCARNMTDGRIARYELRDVSGIARPERHLTALVMRGLWVETDDGWLIHDYLGYQPSRAKVLADRAKKAAAGRVGGVRSGESRRSKREAKPKHDASHLVEDPNPPSSSKKGEGALRAVPDWCRQCHPDTRMFVGDDDRSRPCPRCHPNRGAA
jgi:hypothetical protein